MIDAYCNVCGLFLSVKEAFAGGKGGCPRCRTVLRIPRPRSPEDKDYVEGMRYIAEVARERVPSRRAIIVRSEFGLSARFRCNNCGEEYESLTFPGCDPGECPQCKSLNEPYFPDVSFPRPGAQLSEMLPKRRDSVRWFSRRVHDRDDSDVAEQDVTSEEETEPSIPTALPADDEDESGEAPDAAVVYEPDEEPALAESVSLVDSEDFEVLGGDLPSDSAIMRDPRAFARQIAEEAERRIERAEREVGKLVEEARHRAEQEALAQAKEMETSMAEAIERAEGRAREQIAEAQKRAAAAAQAALQQELKRIEAERQRFISEARDMAAREARRRTEEEHHAREEAETALKTAQEELKRTRAEAMARAEAEAERDAARRIEANAAQQRIREAEERAQKLVAEAEARLREEAAARAQALEQMSADAIETAEQKAAKAIDEAEVRAQQAIAQARHEAEQAEARAHRRAEEVAEQARGEAVKARRQAEIEAKRRLEREHARIEAERERAIVEARMAALDEAEARVSAEREARIAAQREALMAQQELVRLRGEAVPLKADGDAVKEEAAQRVEADAERRIREVEEEAARLVAEAEERARAAEARAREIAAGPGLRNMVEDEDELDPMGSLGGSSAGLWAQDEETADRQARAEAEKRAAEDHQAMRAKIDESGGSEDAAHGAGHRRRHPGDAGEEFLYYPGDDLD